MPAALEFAADEHRRKVVVLMANDPGTSRRLPARPSIARILLEEAEFEAPASTIELMRKLTAERHAVR